MRLLPPLLLILVSLLTVDFSQGESFPPGERATLPQIVARLETRRDAAPNDPEIYFALGRVYYLAAARNAWHFEFFDEDNKFRVYLPEVLTREQDGSITFVDRGPYLDPNKPPEPWISTLSKKTSDSHFTNCAERAVRYFEEAIERSPQDGRYWLGYACVLEDIWSRSFGKDAAQFPPEFQKVRVPSVREAYAKAFRFGKIADSRRWHWPGERNVSVRGEAARALLRLEKAFILSPEEQRVVDSARACK